MTKRAQIKMFETVSVLVVFFFLIAIGIVFYADMRRVNYAQTLEFSDQLKVMSIVQQVNNMKEFQCTTENIGTSNCYDIQKLETFSQHHQEADQYYANYLSHTDLRVTVEQLYPSASPLLGPWVLFDHIPASYAQKSVQHIPILLFDSITRRYNAGAITIEVYT
jgi:hypothetical protein